MLSCLAPSWTWMGPADACVACSCMFVWCRLLVCWWMRACFGCCAGSDCTKPSRFPGSANQLSQHAPLPDLCLVSKPETACDCRDASPIAERRRHLLGVARPWVVLSPALGAWPAHQGMIASASARSGASLSALLQSVCVARLRSG